MDHQTRRRYVAGVFGSFTHTVKQIIPPPPGKKEAQEDVHLAARESLAAFRRHFSGSVWKDRDEKKAMEALTPSAVVRISSEFEPVVKALAVLVPSLAGVDSPVETIPLDSSPDGCAAFDGLLQRIERYGRQVRLHYWRHYRDHLRQVALQEALEFKNVPGALAETLGSFCAYAREVSKGNDEVFGALVEEFIRLRVMEAVKPFTVSSGGIDGLDKMSQLDCIVWDRSVAPPVIEQGNVAIVSPVAAKAILELKSCCDPTLADFSHRIMRLHAEGSVLQDVYEMRLYTQALGVVVWTDYSPEHFSILSGTTIVPLYFREGETLLPNLVGFQVLERFLQLWATPSPTDSS